MLRCHVVARVIAVLAVVLVLIVTSAASLAVPAPDFGDVDEASREAVASGEIPGVVVLVGQGDEILLHRAWGWRSLVPEPDRKSTRLNSSHFVPYRMPSSA